MVQPKVAGWVLKELSVASHFVKGDTIQFHERSSGRRQSREMRYCLTTTATKITARISVNKCSPLNMCIIPATVPVPESPLCAGTDAEHKDKKPLPIML
jgi:hypothetical protein